MADGINYVVEGVKDTTYLHQADQVVEGVIVRVRLVDYDEVRSVKVKSDDPELIRAACEELVKKRQQIAALQG